MTYFATTGLRKAFGGVVAVDGADVELLEGKVNGLIGPNGSGKTTFFNLVTGLISADEGSVHFRGTDLTGKLPYQVAGAGIGRTFQVTRVFPRMTVLQNMLVPVPRTGLRNMVANAVRGEEVERAEHWLEVVGLTHLIDQQARYLSYGQQRLLELAAILMSEPSLILLDEPAGGVNPVLIDGISDVVRQLNADGRTFLIVEHNMEFVMDLCDHIIVFDRGRPIANGDPKTVRNDPAVLEAYLGV